MLPLCDDHIAIIEKAQFGWPLSDRQLCIKAGITQEALAALRTGAVDQGTLLRVAEALGLGGQALLRIATNAWYPQVESPMNGFHVLISRFGNRIVNTYLLWDPQTLDGFVFDLGCPLQVLTEIIRRYNIGVRAAFLTHGHADHAGDVMAAKAALGVPVFISDFEPLLETETFIPLQDWQVGPIIANSRHVPGHSAGSTIYKIDGMDRPMAIVGDALVAGSVGRGNISHRDNLESIRREIFSLPDETVLCPGHGPLTTVGQEKLNNPFFPDLNG
jgi:glyoxylase-like metal-dependent hydrolase (beta-lactamase superfamily II)